MGTGLWLPLVKGSLERNLQLGMLLKACLPPFRLSRLACLMLLERPHYHLSPIFSAPFFHHYARLFYSKGAQLLLHCAYHFLWAAYEEIFSFKPAFACILYQGCAYPPLFALPAGRFLRARESENSFYVRVREGAQLLV